MVISLFDFDLDELENKQGAMDIKIIKCYKMLLNQFQVHSI